MPNLSEISKEMQYMGCSRGEWGQVKELFFYFMNNKEAEPFRDQAVDDVKLERFPQTVRHQL